MKILFERLGLDEKEMKTFLKILELGAQPISVIAKQVGVPRSSMYVILERLKKMQLIEEFVASGITYVKSISVDEIEDLLKIKISETQRNLKMLQEVRPLLQQSENRLSSLPTVVFHQGKRAVMKVYESVIKKNHFSAFFDPQLVNEVMPEYCYKVAQMLKQNNGSARELLTFSKESQNYQKAFNSTKHKIKILPKHVSISSDIIISKDVLYMISYGEEDISATEIKNSSVVATQQVMFDQLWQSL